MAEREGEQVPGLSAEDLVRIIRVLPDVVFECRRGDDGKIYWTFNEGKLADEFHMRTSEIQGRPLDDLFPPESVAVLKPEFERAFAGEGREFVHEIGGRHFKHFPQTVRDANGEVVAVVGFITEVTNLVQAEEEIRGLNRQMAARMHELGAANQDLEAFSYTVSHDLRQPTNRILHTLEELEKTLGQELTGRATNELDDIRKTARGMSHLIDEVLNFSRAGWGPIRPEDVDLSAIAGDVLAVFADSDTDRKVEAVVAPDVVVKGDAAMLRLVLHNLIENAWRHTAGQRDARIEFGVRPGDQGVEYFVRDNGAGFEPGLAEDIFQAFQRAGDGATAGAGIGLATVKRIVGRHGGRAWAESAPGEGASFYFRLQAEPR